MQRHIRNRNRDRRQDGQHDRPGDFRRINNIRQRDDERSHISKRKVLELLEQNSDDIMLKLIDKKFHFDEYMETPTMSNELVVMFTKLLNKAFNSNALQSNNGKIISELVKSNFLLVLVYNSLEEKDIYGNYQVDYIKEVINLLSYILRRNPSNESSIKPLIDRLELVVSLRVRQPDLMDLFDKKIVNVNRIAQKAKPHTMNRPNDLVDPPDHITEIKIIPNLESILIEEKPFLRKNIIAGPYQSVGHYLDVHFRLLREDYLLPLRDGIRAVRNIVTIQKERNPNFTAQILAEIYKRLMKIESIYVYTDVKVGVEKKENLSYYVELSTKKAKDIQWEKTKRFLFGSLVFLSNDFFENNFVVAVISHTELDKKKKGKICVEISRESDVDNIDLTSKYIMLETSALFETYKHVLEALRSFSQLEEDKFPFKKHIVDMDNTYMDPPNYMINKYLDFSPLLYNHSKNGSYSVQSVHRWPSAIDFNMDTSQYDALKLALTKKIAIIQGPPGTGKTFIGVKLLQLLLHNKNLWCGDQKDRFSPILMICYTNHALDQFLELCIKVCKLRTGILRIGGRSKSTNLEEFLLKNVKARIRTHQKMDEKIYYAIRGLRDELRGIEKALKENLKFVNLASNSIIRRSLLQQFMDYEYCRQLNDDQELLIWLGFGDPDQEFQIQMEQLQLQQEQELEGNQLEEEEGSEDEEDDEENENRMLEDDFDDDFVPHQKMLKLNEDVFENVKDQGFSRNEIIKIFKKDDGFITVSKKNKKNDNDPNGIYFDKIIENINDNKTVFTRDLWRLSYDDRIKLYRNWVSQLVSHYQELANQLKTDYDRKIKELNELRLQEDRYIMQQSLIVAMTTTGSARYHSVLRDIGPRIIIVEEAAEVFEAHVVASLSEKCEHLILIGDHVQLRPKPNVYKLEKDYHLDVSLFERLINNGVPSVQLNTQHRMRPEISVLMKHFYPKPIQDAENVFKYPNIIGVTKNITFINHKFREDNFREGQSKTNIYEIQYLVAFCKYLLKQKYEPGQITILTTYLGQYFQLRDELKKNHLKDIKSTTVDNFQGEESDIILLSLVRSNDENNMGFLKIKNRVCVALSRAKWGLYCIGNFEMLKTDQVWKDILSSPVGRSSTQLILSCGKHPENDIFVQKPSDFDLRLEGGCSKKCDYRLDCGHVCPRYCHVYDQDHKEIECLAICNKQMQCGHTCQDYCSHKKSCNPNKCKQIVNKTLPCGHICALKCSNEAKHSDCNQKCAKINPCGHKCNKPCREKCDPCDTLCTVTLLCKHKSVTRVPCGTAKWYFQEKCDQICGAELDCGHICTSKCGECYGGRVHITCKEKCTRLLVCGHTCTEPCSKNCPPCKKKCETKCIHSKCPKRCSVVCTPCFENCTWECEHKKCTNLCYEICNRQPCNEPCKKKIRRCGHPCIGFCGEPCPNLCRICDREKVTEIIFGTEDDPDARFVQLEDCKHVLEAESLEEWFKSQSTNENSNTAISLAQCPKCKTAIRKNLRFSKYIKTQLFYIEQVKVKYAGKDDEILREKLELSSQLSKDSLPYISYQVIDKFVKQLNSKDLNMPDIIEIKNKLSIYEKIRKIDSERRSLNVDSYDFKYFKYETNKLKNILQSDRRFTTQVFNDIINEIKRLTKYCEVNKMEKHIYSRKEAALVLIDKLKKLIVDTVVPYSQIEDNINSLMAQLRPFTSGIQISEEEKTMIVKAFGLSQGHWFKCPNGHVYIITECGGAMQRGKCSECNAEIGGENHNLVSSNSLANEMDGARFAAWSNEANNMANFDMNDLF